MRIGRIAEIWRYPVKSMAGEQLQAATLDALGVPGDRGWALHDDEAGEIRGAKKIPGLLHFAAAYDAEPQSGYTATPVTVTTPDGQTVHSADPTAAATLSAAVGRPVTLTARPDPAQDLDHYRAGARLFPDDPMRELRYVLGLEEDDPIPDLSGLPADLRGFASPPGTYFDCFPLHCLTTASLDELHRLNPDANFDVRRFRPNVLIETEPNLTGFVESAWGGRRLRAGGAVIAINTSAVRCAMPMQSQPGLEFDKGTLRTIKDHNGQHVGVYCSVAEGGEIRVGDDVELLD